MGILGGEWDTERGCLQGDPISVMCSLVLSLLLIHELRSVVCGDWDSSAYLDDMTLTAHSPEKLQELSLAFDQVLTRALMQLGE
eukprot:3223339-Amphidinium_carterae.1